MLISKISWPMYSFLVHNRLCYYCSCIYLIMVVLSTINSKSTMTLTGECLGTQVMFPLPHLQQMVQGVSENYNARCKWNRIRGLQYNMKMCHLSLLLLHITLNRPLQKRERTGKEYGCFPFAWKTKMFKWKIN